MRVSGFGSDSGFRSIGLEVKVFALDILAPRKGPGIGIYGYLAIH